MIRTPARTAARFAGLTAAALVVSVVTGPAAIARTDDSGADASLYSKTAKGTGTVNMKKPLAQTVRVKRFWAGHDGESVYLKVKMRHLPTPADIAAAEPNATWHLSFGAAQEVDENGQPAILGFGVGDLYVTATETKVVKIRQDDDPNNCRTELDYDVKTRIVTASGLWTCMPGYAPPADGDPARLDVFVSTEYADADEQQKKSVADAMIFDDVT